MTNRNQVQITVIGGLGNQLFTYFAGISYCEMYGKELVVNLGQLETIGTSHGASIARFKLPHKVIYSRDRTYLTSWKRIRSFLVRKDLLSVGRLAKFFGHYSTSQIGFDPEFWNTPNLSRVEGYFQSYRYFEALQNQEMRTLELENPTKWFVEYSALLDIEKTIVLHVRRGDFRKHRETVGLLSQDYYLRAVDEIDKLRGDRLPIWVFSDEIDQARALLKVLSNRVVKFVNQPKDSSANESLLMMSRASAIVIANSTFSWWAAFLGPKKIVVAPKEWFRTASNPLDLHPPNWNLIQSSWE